MTTLKWLASFSLAIVTFPAIYGEPHCPGNVASIRPRFVERYIIIVPVAINHTGPYDFAVDTAAQITTIDPSLASDLHLKILGTTGVIGAGSYTPASYAQLELLQTGASVTRNPLVVIQDLGQLQVTDPRVRGILGENFLEHFDLLIDYAHGILCLDETKQMQQKVKGEHIALVPPPHPERSLPFTQPLIIPVHVSDIPERQLLLQLDSATNAPLLFDPVKELALTPFASAPLHSRGTDGVVRAFAILAPQDIQVGAHAFYQISFVTPVAAGKDVPPKPEGEGVLPTILFQRAFISYADHYAVLKPW